MVLLYHGRGEKSNFCIIYGRVELKILFIYKVKLTDHEDAAYASLYSFFQC